MGTITLRGLGLAFQRPLFSGLDLTLGRGERLGLVAGNGAGKSSLLRCIAGRLEPSAGEILRSRGLTVGFVEQDPPEAWAALSLAEVVRRGLPPGEREGEGWRVEVLLEDLGTPPELLERPMQALSGGWQRLAMLARAAVAEPDLLLLDEPSNHLDLRQIQRLEAWLTGPSAPAMLIVASHDRAFLDRVTQRTLFLSPERGRLFAHPFTRARALLEEERGAEAAKLAKDAKEVKRLRRSAGELKNIGINSRSDAAQKKAQQMARRADALEESLRGPERERPGLVRLETSGSHAKVLLSLKGVTVERPGGGALFRLEKLELRQGERAVLLGRNGVGKSCLLALLRRAVEGETVAGVRVAPSVVPGILDQQQADLPGDASPFALVSRGFSLGDQRCVSLLAGAGFAANEQGRPLASFSPGQRARLALLLLRLAEPNLYLLDEPTNHVDIAGREALEAEILEQQASALFVSHDRRFVEAVATRFLLVERGRLREIDSPEVFYRQLSS